jgi:hypothetical protein
VFYPKLHDRLLLRSPPRTTHPAPLRLRKALHTIDTYLDDYIGQSCVAAGTLAQSQEPTAEDR